MSALPQVLERAVRDLNFRGGYIGTNVNGTYYGTTDFDPFWAKAQERSFSHVTDPSGSNARIRSSILGDKPKRKKF